MSMSEWAESEIKLAESEVDSDFSDYYKGCCESALDAFRVLCGAGHSGMSMSITKSILMRLIDGMPLTPLTGEDSEWVDVTSSFDQGKRVFQNKRMSSVFKHVGDDGTVEYRDVNLISCQNKGSATCYHNGFVDKIIYEIFPITFPYYPQATICVTCEDFSVDSANGDFDTLGIFYATVGTDRTEINRFFKSADTDSGWEEISEQEYNERRKLADLQRD